MTSGRKADKVLGAGLRNIVRWKRLKSGMELCKAVVLCRMLEVSDESKSRMKVFVAV